MLKNLNWLAWFIVLLVLVLVIRLILGTEVKDVVTKLPDAKTLIAVLSVLAVPVTTLIVLGVTQRNNRKTKEIELNHQSELKDKELRHQSSLKDKELEAQERLKVLELREENGRIARAEKRSVYKDILGESRHIVHYWADAGSALWYPQVQHPSGRLKDPDQVVENAKTWRHSYKLKEWQAEADSIASETVVGLIGTFADFIRGCEQRVIFEMQEQGITDPRTQDIRWRSLQAALRQEFREQGVQAAYFALRGQIRKELDAT